MIVDEEQRFGVAQKELLRQLRLEVDVLALSRDADPAHAAHVARRAARHLGDRDAAGGPPPDPHATSASTTRTLIKQALERELARDGQAFYLHNRVETIEEAAEKLRQLCPNARVLVAHGQMPRARARGPDADVPRRRRRRARLDDDHRVGARHPAGEHADRRARRPARPRAALPDPRPRRPQRRARARVPLLSGGARADARGARAPRDARRPHRARRRASRSRCATSRSAAPATCSAPSSRATSPRSASSSTSRCCTRRSPSSPASGGSPRARCASTRASTRSCRPATSPPRR